MNTTVKKAPGVVSGILLICVLLFTTPLHAQKNDHTATDQRIEDWNNRAPVLLQNQEHIHTTLNSSSLQLDEDFSDNVFPPAGWSRHPETDQTGQSWFRNTPSVGAFSGDFIAQSASWLQETGPLVADNWLITPRLQVTESDNTLTFYSRSICAGFFDPLTFYVSTTGRNLEDFKDDVFTIATLPNQWTQYTVDLSAYEGMNIYIAFQHEAEDQCAVLLDLIQGPEIYQPAGAGIFATTTMHFDAVFNLGSSTRTLEIGNIGGEPLTLGLGLAGSTLNVSGLPVTVPPGETRTITVELNSAGLTPGYYSTSFSLATNDVDRPSYPVQVSANIVDAIFTDFLFEDFESVASRQIPDGWTGTFQVRTFGGIDDSHRFTRLFDDRAAFQSASFTTSFVELGDEPEMSFYYRIVNFEDYVVAPTPGDATSINFTAVISTDFGDTFDTIWTYDPADHITGLDYRQIDVDLTGYENETLLFGIMAEWASGEVFLDIDNLQAGTMPDTPDFSINPHTSYDFGEVEIGGTSSHTFRISNNSGGTLDVLTAGISGVNADNFSITGFAPQGLEFGESMTFEVSFSPQTLTGKEAQLDVAYNDGSVESATVMLTGIGIDQTVRAFFREDFETVPPAGWAIEYGQLSSSTSFEAWPSGNNFNRWVVDEYYDSADNGSAARANLFVSGSNYPPLKWWIISPSIDLDEIGGSPLLKFDLGLTAWASGEPAALEPGDHFAVVISTDNGQTWSDSNILFELKGSEGDAIPGMGESYTVDLNGYSGEIKLGFYVERLAGSGSDLKLFLASAGIHETEVREMTFAGWNMLALPADKIRIRELAAANQIQGVPGIDAYYGVTGYEAGASNFYFFDDVAPDGSATHPGWTVPSSVNSSVSSGKGFIWFYFGNPGQFVNPLPFDLHTTGLTPTDAVEQSLNENNDFTLLGNPFTGNLDRADISGPIQADVLVWDHVTAQFVPTTVIAPFQGYFAEKSSDGTVVMDQGSSSPRANDPAFVNLKLTGTNEAGATLKDHSVRVVFDEDAGHGWDRYDLTKMRSLNHTTATLSVIGEKFGEPVLKVVDSRPVDLDDMLELPLGLDIVNFSGEFSLSADLNNIPEEWQLYLVDLVTGEKVNARNEELHFNHTAERINENPPIAPEQLTLDAEKSVSRFVVQVIPASTSADPASDLPRAFSLSQNYPNPFNPATQIGYELSEAADVTLEVFNSIGQRVAVLVNSHQQPGRYVTTFDASALSSGVYLYRIRAGNFVETRKMMLVK